jgi:hypothetical protein
MKWALARRDDFTVRQNSLKLSLRLCGQMFVLAASYSFPCGETDRKGSSDGFILAVTR